jgi:glycosyltransferase involved in cell wall biosynthesis
VRVLLDVSAVPDQITGAGVYTTELVRALAPRDDLELTLAARKTDRARWAQLAPTADIRNVAPSARPARLAWEQLAGPRLAAEAGADVWHGPHYTMPLRLGIPAVVTVHDLTFFDHPEWHERAKVFFFRWAIRASARRAATLVCVSDATARRLDALALPKGSVFVVNHGVDTARFTTTADDDDRARLDALGVTPPYLAFVGTIEPRKNVPALVDAFTRVAADHDGLSLVLAGRDAWGTGAVDAAVASSSVASRIVRTGYVPADTLPAMFRGASAVVYPSFEEGFGLPPLEAMACGAPVLTTADVAAADLAGGAVVAIQDADPESLADGIRHVLDPATQARLRAAGPAVAAGFSWAAAAERHVEAYRAAAATGVSGGPRRR